MGAKSRTHTRGNSNVLVRVAERAKSVPVRLSTVEASGLKPFQDVALLFKTEPTTLRRTQPNPLGFLLSSVGGYTPARKPASRYTVTLGDGYLATYDRIVNTGLVIKADSAATTSGRRELAP